jgi:membrane protein required for beta-lactamase induction
MFLVATRFTVLGIAIYRGKTDLIHDYHQTRVTDKSAYGKAFGKAMLFIAAVMLLSGIIGLFENLVILAVAILIIGLVIGIGCIVAVQRKYNKGVF